MLSSKTEHSIFFQYLPFSLPPHLASTVSGPKHAHVVLLMYFALLGVASRFLCVTGNQSMGKRYKFAVGVKTT